MKFVTEQLETTKFVYNNKIHSATKTFPFKANYGQDPRMEFEGKRKEKFETTEKFIEKIKKIQKKIRAALEKVQEKMKRYVDRKQGEVEEYKIEDLVLLSIKDLK